MNLKASALAACAAVLLGAAQAQEGKTHLIAYKAFTEAQAAGDKEAVIRHGEAAWRAAEAELGPHETTALLAQNLVYEAIWTEPDIARPAAARALELGRDGLGLSNLSLPELEIADAYLQATEKRSGERRDRLTAALIAEDAPLTALRIGAAQRAANLLVDENDDEAAYVVTTALARELEDADDVPTGVLALTNMQRVVAMLAQKKYRSGLPTERLTVRADWKDRLKDAHVLIDHTAALFEPQEDIEDFDPLFAASYAWHSVIGALERTHKIEVSEDWTFEGRQMTFLPPAIAGRESENEEPVCPITWEERSLRYPRGAQRKGYIGGVLLGYHLTADGRVEDARILSEVPADRFGPAILRQVERWQAETDGVSPECLRNQVASIQFIMRN